MKRITFVLCFVLIGITSCKEKKPVEINIIPKPVSIVKGNNWIEWKKEIQIIAATEDEKSVASFLQEFLQTKGVRASIVAEEGSTGDQTVLSIAKNASLGDEGYQLVINESGVRISAQSGAGLFYGVQSLFQLIVSSNETIELPFVEIQDQPRFVWRGLHLDVGRHYLPVSFIKKYIDLMSHYKL